MKERPILFSAPMVRAILDGSKTQTRRVVKRQPSDHHWQCLPGYLLRFTLTAFAKAMGLQFHHTIPQNPNQDSDRQIMCPYGQPGDRLWVRETFSYLGTNKRGPYAYRASSEGGDPVRVDAPWKPSIHMPRAASRILLEIVSVRVERLNECSEADAIAEGIEKWGEPHPRRGQRWNCPPHAQRFGSGENVEDAGFAGGPVKDPREAYRGLWASINGPGSWEANPWVWVVEFKRVTP